MLPFVSDNNSAHKTSNRKYLHVCAFVHANMCASVCACVRLHLKYFACISARNEGTQWLVHVRLGVHVCANIGPID